jgi:hypothetical protein
LTGLSFGGSNFFGAEIFASQGAILLGTGLQDVYQGISGPSSFGSGGFFVPSSSSGSLVGISRIFSNGEVNVPLGYSSNTFLSSSSTYNNATFISLGVTPGAYKWTWGTGANQNFTFQIGPAHVPDEGSSLTLLSIVVLCWLGFDLGRRRLIKA